MSEIDKRMPKFNGDGLRLMNAWTTMLTALYTALSGHPDHEVSLISTPVDGRILVTVLVHNGDVLRDCLAHGWTQQDPNHVTWLV